jgi:hypothetical protein
LISPIRTSKSRELWEKKKRKVVLDEYVNRKNEVAPKNEKAGHAPKPGDQLPLFNLKMWREMKQIFRKK